MKRRFFGPHTQTYYMAKGDYLVKVYGKEDMRKFREAGYRIIPRRDLQMFTMPLIDTRDPNIYAALQPIFEAMEINMGIERDPS